MAANAQQEQFRLGFLAAAETAEGGHVGGLLVTNHFGRPLEFQCTTPVKPNRTQEILYGPTLIPFVLTELIGRTLVEKIGVKPQLILVDVAELLELRQHIAVPVASVRLNLPESGEPDEASDRSAVIVGRHRFRVHPEHSGDTTAIQTGMKLVPTEADLTEPFERVRGALGEALQLRGAA